MMKFTVTLVMLLFSLSVFGKKLYKFKDENGNWSFTDRSPNTEAEVTVKQLDVQNKQLIFLLKSGDSQQPDYYFHNDYAGPVEIEVKFVNKVNVLSFPDLPSRFVVKNGKSDTVFRVRSADSSRPWEYKLEYNSVVGYPMKHYFSDEGYLPPIEPNKSFQVAQAFGGEFSHTDKENKYAVDITMPVGTPIFAARDGQVMSVDSDFYKNGIDKKYLSKANNIRILHDDGSMALYAHLELEKLEVYPGLKVRAGKLIGYSGNTGYSSGPHLHFVVQYNRGMELVSTPFKFFNKNGQLEEPIVGKMLVGISTNLD